MADRILMEFTGAVFVYGLTDPRTHQLRYIGVSKHPEKRIKSHASAARNGAKPMCSKWIRGLLKIGLSPDMFIIEESNNLKWMEDESFWIAYFRFIGCNLLNMTSGGEGTMAYTHSPITREKLSKSNKGKKRSAEIVAAMRLLKPTEAQRIAISKKLTGRPMPKDISERISITLTGRSRPDDVKKKISDSHKGKKLSAEHIAKVAAHKRNQPLCVRGHERTPGSVCKTCSNIRARLYTRGLSGKLGYEDQK